MLKEKSTVIYDARHILNEYSGLARYTYYLLEGLVALSSVNIVVLLPANAPDNSLFKKIKSMEAKGYLKTETVGFAPFSFRHYFLTFWLVNRIKNDVGSSIYFYPHFDIPFFMGSKSIFVIHDLFPLVVSDYIVKFRLLKKVVFFALCFHSLIKKGRRVIMISQSTKNDVKKFFGRCVRSDVCVVLSSDCVLPSHAEAKVNLDIEAFKNRQYLLYVGDRRPHKNLRRMIDIYRLLKSRYGYTGEFVLVGSVQNFDFDLDEYANGDLTILGNVSDYELRILYENMDSLFFLSKYEGFGLPIVEAARLNKKLITSTNGALLEVTPETGLNLNLSKANDELAEEVAEYLMLKLEIDNAKFVRRFSWETTARNIFILSGKLASKGDVA